MSYIAIFEMIQLNIADNKTPTRNNPSRLFTTPFQTEL